MYPPLSRSASLTASSLSVFILADSCLRTYPKSSGGCNLTDIGLKHSSSQIVGVYVIAL